MEYVVRRHERRASASLRKFVECGRRDIQRCHGIPRLCSVWGHCRRCPTEWRSCAGPDRMRGSLSVDEWWSCLVTNSILQTFYRQNIGRLIKHFIILGCRLQIEDSDSPSACSAKKTNAESRPRRPFPWQKQRRCGISPCRHLPLAERQHRPLSTPTSDEPEQSSAARPSAAP